VGFVMKVFAAGDPKLERVGDYHVDAIMLDSAEGGSGKVFDWSLAENLPLDKKLVLAGGLTPDNVTEAIARVRPWGVDVSTGVERSPGRKDATKVMRFINAAKAAGENQAVEIDLDDDGRPVLDPYDYDWEEDTSVG
jgi:phosphoribosylanthranilate isomerase